MQLMKQVEQHGEADLNKINLAYVLSDAQKIYIPSINDSENQSFVTGEFQKYKNEGNNQSENKIMVNINTASEQELENVPGIGGVIAKRIVEYRKENGKFNSIEDIKSVTGIGSSKFNNIKNYICVK